MDDKRYRQLKLMVDIVDHPLFQELIDKVKADISRETFETDPDNRERREVLYFEHHLVDRMVRRLTSFANEARKLDHAVRERLGVTDAAG